MTKNVFFVVFVFVLILPCERCHSIQSEGDDTAIPDASELFANWITCVAQARSVSPRRVHTTVICGPNFRKSVSASDKCLGRETEEFQSGDGRYFVFRQSAMMETGAKLPEGEWIENVSFFDLKANPPGSMLSRNEANGAWYFRKHRELTGGIDTLSTDFDAITCLPGFAGNRPVDPDSIFNWQDVSISSNFASFSVDIENPTSSTPCLAGTGKVANHFEVRFSRKEGWLPDQIEIRYSDYPYPVSFEYLDWKNAGTVKLPVHTKVWIDKAFPFAFDITLDQLEAVEYREVVKRCNLPFYDLPSDMRVKESPSYRRYLWAMVFALAGISAVFLFRSRTNAPRPKPANIQKR